MPLSGDTVLGLYPWDEDESDEPLYQDTLDNITERAASGDIEPRQYFAEDRSTPREANQIPDEYVVTVCSDGQVETERYVGQDI